jgi:hypothetical protein
MVAKPATAFPFSYYAFSSFIFPQQSSASEQIHR